MFNKKLKEQIKYQNIAIDRAFDKIQELKEQIEQLELVQKRFITGKTAILAEFISHITAIEKHLKIEVEEKYVDDDERKPPVPQKRIFVARSL